MPFVAAIEPIHTPAASYTNKPEPGGPVPLMMTSSRNTPVCDPGATTAVGGFWR